MSRRGGVLAAIATGAVVAVATQAPAAAPSKDALHAGSAVPPGQSGNTTLAQFTAATTGASDSYGPHTDDQRVLYETFHYKPMQFTHAGQGDPPPGDPNVKIWRDAKYGVPTITGKTDADVFYGIGYAMANDRLFQMDVFRHVGHGTLSELIGPAGLAMDEEVRRVTEGPAALQKEFNRLPAPDRLRGRQFVAGINAYIDQVQGDVSRMPAEYTLLNQQPIRHFTLGDVLAFGEYAGRFFGEFGHGELGAALTYRHLIKRFGQRKGERLFHDLLPLGDKHAPTSIAARDGRFPRHTKGHVNHRYKPSRYANHDPKTLPTTSQLAHIAPALTARAATLARLQRTLALPRFGSNAVLVSGRMTTTRKPMIYGGPQTGWAVPGFFWEAELHSPTRAQRGVMVPAIPLIVIGRNARAAWTVTSALDANADTFVEKLDNQNRHYRNKGRRLTVAKHTETIPCKDPPTEALDLLGPSVPKTCPQPPRTVTVYRTVHGPAIAGPDSGHHLYVRKSVVDNHLLQSLVAWDLAGRGTNVKAFGDALKRMSLGFNFFYAGDDGHIGYWHTGAYPLRPKNADPTLPQPGGGAYDWRGLERWRAHPHVIDPKGGYLVNWNNKPSVGWWSKNLSTGGEGGIWGRHWESEALAKAVRRRAPLDYDDVGKVPRDVAFTDNRARVFLPTLRRALKNVKDPRLRKIRTALSRWNGQRNVADGNGEYGTPAVVFFDRFVERVMRDVERPKLGGDWVENAGLDCPLCHLRSIDNLAAPTYKFEYAGEQLLASALERKAVARRWLRHPLGVFRRAARETAARLRANQGANPSKWNEAIETGEFSAQGAISVPPLVPLPNRGSYGQVVETTGARGKP
jgi:penicillin amidase